jgi:RNA polymerase sigma-70 factor (ECF subfamily)
VDGGSWDWADLTRRCVREARRYTRSQSDAEDVAQEAVLRAWRHRASCRTPQASRAWVLSICRNEALRRLRPAAAEVPFDESKDAVAPDSLQHVAAALDLRSAIADLSQDDRALIWLRYGLDLTQSGAAKALGMPEGTAKVRLHRLRSTLCDRLEDHG